MSLSRIAFFAFALAAVLVAGFQHADAASHRNNWSGTANSVISSLEDARFDHAKGYPQGY